MPMRTGLCGVAMAIAVFVLALVTVWVTSGPVARAEQAVPPTVVDADGVTKTWAIAEFGVPKYRDDFQGWPYANPDAPKGGRVVLGGYGSFDSLNFLILRGSWPAGIGLIGDSLMAESGDELGAVYGLVAETVEYPADKSWIIFNLRPEARYHDGVSVTAEDVKFTFDTLREIGRPFLQSFLKQVADVEVLSEHRIKFTMTTRDTMKPLVTLGTMLLPLPRHWWQDRDISQTTLEPLLGNGAYRIADIDPGRSITYRRVEDYWGKDLAVSQGIHNFDEIHYEYFRDETVLFEAFLAGRLDFRAENRAQRWATGYDTEDVKAGRIVRREIPNHEPRGAYGYMMNARRPPFDDIRVRKALNYIYDFEAIQRTVLYDQYRRIKSWFPNSDYGASGPPTEAEKAVLAPYANQVRPEVLTEAFEPPQSPGTGRNRRNQRVALQLLQEAGWRFESGKLINAQTGQPFRFEILLQAPSLVRVTQPFVRDLQQLGIDASIRVVDPAQYAVRTDEYDYDVVIVALTFFPPPGTELASYFASQVVDIEGQGNFAGIRNPVVDALLQQIVDADTLEAKKVTTRALDRVLLWGWHMIPMYFNDEDWLAFWDRFGWPERPPFYDNGFVSTWWVDPAKDAALAGFR